jgi:N,N'-diacetyllegionaminate synthase
MSAGTTGVVRVGEREIGPDRPCFVIAEAGVNHNGRMDLALQLVDAAADAGADAVKFQTFVTEKLISPGARKAAYQAVNTNDATEGQFEMVKRLELPFSAFREIADHAAKRGITFMSTPFDADSLAFLVSLGMPLVKVPSGEIDNPLLLRKVGATRLPVILSTGMATLADIDEALRTLRAAGSREIIVLQCTSNYPAAPEDANLRTIPALHAALGVPVGYSDHTLGVETALAAVALGACVIEKHFTLDRSLPGPDHPASMTTQELAALVRGVREVESALGDGAKRPRASEEDTRAVARRSLFLAKDVAAGTVIDTDALNAMRPSGGISPRFVDLVLGRRLKRGLEAGAMLAWEDLA